MKKALIFLSVFIIFSFSYGWGFVVRSSLQAQNKFIKKQRDENTEFMIKNFLVKKYIPGQRLIILKNKKRYVLSPYVKVIQNFQSVPKIAEFWYNSSGNLILVILK